MMDDATKDVNLASDVNVQERVVVAADDFRHPHSGLDSAAKLPPDSDSRTCALGSSTAIGERNGTLYLNETSGKHQDQ